MTPHHSRSGSTLKLVGFTSARSWSSVLPVVRIVGPAEHAGLTLIKGNVDQRIMPELVSQGDLVFVQRDFPRNEDVYGQIVARAHLEGKPVVLDLDDLLTELPAEHADKRTRYYADALVPMIRALVDADAVTASTAPLCAYLRTFNPNVWLAPNYLDDRLWELRSRSATADPGPIILGYMGSHTHLADLESIKPALLRVLEKYGDGIVLRFWGSAPPPDGIRERPNVEWVRSEYEYADFAAYFSKQECDLFLAPLADNLFNRCKSPLKYLEYGALGVPGVYSRIEPYAGLVVHGENGFLASTQSEWEQQLSELIESPESRAAVGQKAQETVRNNWMLSQHADEWVGTLQQIISTAAGRQRPASTIFVVDQVRRLQREADEAEIVWRTAALSRQLDAEREAARSQLAAKDARMAAICRSNTWKLAQRILLARLWLAPIGSHRERFLVAVMRRFNVAREMGSTLLGEA
jgi:glycosyltransferase involved in cell wall biosynthesis